jgi:hypothetical protein
MKKPLAAIDSLQFNLNILPVDYASKCSRNPSSPRKSSVENKSFEN